MAAPSKGSNGGNTNSPRLSKPSVTRTAMNPETKKGKEMLPFYQDRVLLKVNDQLARGEDMFVLLLMGSLLKESTRMAYTYSRGKFPALKAITTTTKLKKDLEEAKKEAKQKSTQLSEVNKQLLATKKLAEDLRKEINDMSSTAQVEVKNEALTKDVKSLKDEREGLWNLLSNLNKDKKVL
uniref:Uncharacterized protein n=1 Tax=Cannabis sativa TaxID=3483 RepID=A0A803Q0V9_CANSA